MSFGFIITRHVRDQHTNKYWNHSIKLIRTFYPTVSIIIIDDNSDQNFVKSEFPYKNIMIINSEYPGRGELLPYIYYIEHKWFDKAIILHDSTFIHKRIKFYIKYPVVSLFHFENNDSELQHVLNISNKLTNNAEIKHKLVNYNTGDWNSCHGVQSIINHDFLVYINEKYSLTNLLDVIKNRNDRCALERIFGAIFFVETKNNTSFFGNINLIHKKFKNCDYTYSEYISLFKQKKIILDVVKVWTGR
jgi:hypothetical protein